MTNPTAQGFQIDGDSLNPGFSSFDEFPGRQEYDYGDEEPVESDFDENLAEHAKVTLSYFKHMYDSETAIDLSLHWAGDVLAKGHRLIVAAFCRKLDPIINESSGSGLIKLDIRHLEIEPEDLRAVFDFFYTGRICIRGPGVLRALNELGCFHILPLLEEIWKDGYPVITVQDKYHAINFLNRLKEFKNKRQFIDCSLRVQSRQEIECHRFVAAAYCTRIQQSLRPTEAQVFCLEVDSTIEAVSSMVQFMYSGDIPFGFYELESLKKLSFSFGIKQLTDYFLEDNFFVPNSGQYRTNDADTVSSSAADPQSGGSVERSGEIDYVEVYNEFVEGPKVPSYKQDDDVGGLVDPFSPRSSRDRYRYKCPNCEYTGCDQATIRKHIRCIHTQETPYKCNKCGKMFKIQSNMMRHLRTHSQVKPYKCKECGSVYADKKNMDAHIFKVHMKLEAFKCPYSCQNSKFYRDETWVKHFQKNHLNEGPMIPFQLRPIPE